MRPSLRPRLFHSQTGHHFRIGATINFCSQALVDEWSDHDFAHSIHTLNVTFIHRNYNHDHNNNYFKAIDYIVDGNRYPK